MNKVLWVMLAIALAGFIFTCGFMAYTAGGALGHVVGNAW